MRLPVTIANLFSSIPDSNLMDTCFFCGIGGSGMLPLAQLLRAKGHAVRGSDRGYDQGKSLHKFEALKDLGVEIFPQDGSGVSGSDFFVVSSAVEDTIPDVRAAKELDVPIQTRGQMLARQFNDAEFSVAVAGTSGKSTVTGMVGTMLTALGRNPTVVNGAGVINFSNASSVRMGDANLFVAEMDESDGSIAHYSPSVAVLNNIALDHMSMEELEKLFGDYVAKAERSVVLNAGQLRVMGLKDRANADVLTYGIDIEADLVAMDLKPQPFSIEFKVNGLKARLAVPGRYNVENALAALSVGVSMGFELEQCIDALGQFKGIHRRMELIGVQNGISVIDDFAHNPDKISASLQALKSFEGRVIVMFQPHGFGPLRLMGAEIVDAFTKYLDSKDLVLMPEVYYAGGTVDRSVTAKHIIDDLNEKGLNARWFETRVEIPDFLSSCVVDGDRVVVMGARDDTLHEFAQSLFQQF